MNDSKRQSEHVVILEVARDVSRPEELYKCVVTHASLSDADVCDEILRMRLQFLVEDDCACDDQQARDRQGAQAEEDETCNILLMCIIGVMVSLH